MKSHSIILIAPSTSVYVVYCWNY